ncbi:MAG: DUF1272 domain-containing protein [Oceanihabitans sp.]
MLEIRPTCEHCNIALPNHSKDARICTFECTYCKSCANEVFKKVCPNCGGNFSKRPIRPENLLKKYPVSTTVVFKPKDVAAHIKKYKL